MLLGLLKCRGVFLELSMTDIFPLYEKIAASYSISLAYRFVVFSCNFPTAYTQGARRRGETPVRIRVRIRLEIALSGHDPMAKSRSKERKGERESSEVQIKLQLSLG